MFKRRKIGSKKKGRQVRRGLGTRLAPYIHGYQKRSHEQRFVTGVPRSFKWPDGPYDTTTFTDNQVYATIAAGSQTISSVKSWGWGSEIGQLLSDIRSESVYTLVGGSYVLQPTLCAEGYTNHWWACPFQGKLLIDWELYTFRSNVTKSGDAAVLTDWTNALAEGYDSVPTGYATFPTTELGVNYVFRSARKSYRRVGAGRLIAAPGKPAVLNIRHRPKCFAYADYSATNALTQGCFANRTYWLISRIVPEDAINCGQQSAASYPLSAPGYGAYIVGVRRVYRYKWVAGNNKPTIRGNYNGPNDIIPLTGPSFLADPLGHFQWADTAALAANVNSTRHYSAMAVNSNPVDNCALGTWTVDVDQ